MVGNSDRDARRAQAAAGGGPAGSGSRAARPPCRRRRSRRWAGRSTRSCKQGYVRLADGQWSDVRPRASGITSAARRESAMLGDTVWPDKVASRAVPAGRAGRGAGRLRERLLRALEGGARESAPVDAARRRSTSTAGSRSSSGSTTPAPLQRLPGDRARGAALAEAEHALVDTPYLVYLRAGSDQLDPDAQNVVYHRRARRARSPSRPRSR